MEVLVFFQLAPGIAIFYSSADQRKRVRESDLQEARYSG